MLMDFLNFTFSGFWHFVGMWLLIASFGPLVSFKKIIKKKEDE